MRTGIVVLCIAAVLQNPKSAQIVTRSCSKGECDAGVLHACKGAVGLCLTLVRPMHVAGRGQLQRVSHEGFMYSEYLCQVASEKVSCTWCGRAWFSPVNPVRELSRLE